jgi:hypothetical protein
MGIWFFVAIKLPLQAGLIGRECALAKELGVI